MKQYTKALNQTKSYFQYLKVIFHKISDAKIKEGLFVGPHICRLSDNKDFNATMKEFKLAAWHVFMHSEMYLGKSPRG